MFNFFATDGTQPPLALECTVGLNVLSFPFNTRCTSRQGKARFTKNLTSYLENTSMGKNIGWISVCFLSNVTSGWKRSLANTCVTNTWIYCIKHASALSTYTVYTWNEIKWDVNLFGFAVRSLPQACKKQSSTGWIHNMKTWTCLSKIFVRLFCTVSSCVDVFTVFSY